MNSQTNNNQINPTKIINQTKSSEAEMKWVLSDEMNVENESNQIDEVIPIK